MYNIETYNSNNYLVINEMLWDINSEGSVGTKLYPFSIGIEIGDVDKIQSLLGNQAIGWIDSSDK